MGILCSAKHVKDLADITEKHSEVLEDVKQNLQLAGEEEASRIRTQMSLEAAHILQQAKEEAVADRYDTLC